MCLCLEEQFCVLAVCVFMAKYGLQGICNFSACYISINVYEP